MEEVILVDQADRAIGRMEKLQAHQEGRLHRGFSICLFDHQGRWLLQKRALKKYHSAGLLTNSCCSHPRPNETVESAAYRRMLEELGVECPLVAVGTVLYREQVGSELVEHEFDHLFIGQHDGPFALNPEEVEAVEWWDKSRIKEALRKTPDIFTKWFPIVFEAVVRRSPA